MKLQGNQPTTPSPAPAQGRVSVTVADFAASVLARLEPLESEAVTVLASRPTGQRVSTVNVTYETAASRVVLLVRNHPELAAVCDPAAVDQGTLDLGTARQGAARLRALADLLEYNGELSFDGGWKQCRKAILLAEHTAKEDNAMEVDLAPVRATLARGRLTATTAQTAEDAQRAADAALARATKAQQKADKARRSAARVAQAHAENHATAAATTVGKDTPHGSSR